jgi:hypothetical protein
MKARAISREPSPLVLYLLPKRLGPFNEPTVVTTDLAGLVAIVTDNVWLCSAPVQGQGKELVIIR